MPNIKLSRIRKEYLLLISIILMAVCAGFAMKKIFLPLLGKINEATLQIEQKEMNIKKASIDPKTLKGLEDEIEQYKISLASYQKRLTALPDMPEILREFTQMAEQLKIKFVSINPLEKKEMVLSMGEELLLEIPIRIRLQCGYHELGKFINQIENSPRYTKISELKINNDPKSIWTEQVELVITSYALISISQPGKGEHLPNVGDKSESKI